MATTRVLWIAALSVLACMWLLWGGLPVRDSSLEFSSVVTAAPAASTRALAAAVRRVETRKEKPSSDSWTPLWNRRFMSMPDATLFTHDADLRHLITAASGVGASTGRSTVMNNTPSAAGGGGGDPSSPSLSIPAGCQTLRVSSFLVASGTLQAAAELCFLDHWYTAPPTGGATRSASGAPDGSPLLLMPFVKIRLDTPPRMPNGGISTDPTVQAWLDQAVGPLEFSVVSEVRLFPSPSFSSSRPTSGGGGASTRGKPLFHRIASGFTVYNKLSLQYIAFMPVVVDAAASLWDGSLNGTSLVRLLAQGSLRMELSLNVKVQREAYWAVNDVFHRVGGRTNLYALDKGHTAQVPMDLWALLEKQHASETVVLDGLRPGACRGAFTGWWESGGHQRDVAAQHESAQLNHGTWSRLKGYPLVFGNAARKQASGRGGLGSLFRHPTSWMITGDSQSRSIFRALRDEFTLHSQEVAQHAPNSTSINGGDSNYPGGKILAAASRLPALNAVITYRWDNYLGNLSSTLVDASNSDSNAMVVVTAVGMGSHPASWGQYTFLQYEMDARRVAKTIYDYLQHSGGVESVRQRRIVVWYGAPAWPKPKLVDKFRITNSRLGLFNYVALAALSAEHRNRRRRRGGGVVAGGGVRHLDFFGMTHPVLKWSKDGSHFDKSMVMPMVVEALRNEVGDALKEPTAGG